MKGKDVKIGETYIAKVSGNLCEVSITRESPLGRGWYGVNLKTKRTIHIRSAARLRPLVKPQKPAPVVDGHFAEVAERPYVAPPQPQDQHLYQSLAELGHQVYRYIGACRRADVDFWLNELRNGGHKVAVFREPAGELITFNPMYELGPGPRITFIEQPGEPEFVYSRPGAKHAGR